MDRKIVDVCCGSKMFYFDKENPNVLFLDNREVEMTLCDGRRLTVKPDKIEDFTNLSLESNSVKVVVFDPPHMVKLGDNAWLKHKYGRLPNEWRTYLKKGFDECIRILEPFGILIFKWNEEQIKASDILDVFGQKPLIGDKRSKTHWMIFIKTQEKL